MTFKDRGLNASSILDGNYVLDGGAERLVIQWTSERGRQIAKRDGTAEDDSDPPYPDLHHLLQKAGSPSFNGKIPEHMPLPEYFTLLTVLAPNESDGSDDREVWNLFDEYLPTRRPGSLDNQHDLSQMLARWKAHTVSKHNQRCELHELRGAGHTASCEIGGIRT